MSDRQIQRGHWSTGPQPGALCKLRKKYSTCRASCWMTWQLLRQQAGAKARPLSWAWPATPLPPVLAASTSNSTPAGEYSPLHTCYTLGSAFGVYAGALLSCDGSQARESKRTLLLVSALRIKWHLSFTGTPDSLSHACPVGQQESVLRHKLKLVPAACAFLRCCLHCDCSDAPGCSKGRERTCVKFCCDAAGYSYCSARRTLCT